MNAGTETPVVCRRQQLPGPVPFWRRLVTSRVHGLWDDDLSERKPSIAVAVLAHVGEAERLSALERTGDAEEQFDLAGSGLRKIHRHGLGIGGRSRSPSSTRQ